MRLANFFSYFNLIFIFFIVFAKFIHILSSFTIFLNLSKYMLLPFIYYPHIINPLFILHFKKDFLIYHYVEFLFTGLINRLAIQ